ncbi:hypothetical protein N2152v2_000876 [Parachlorella kessleri]
MRPMLVTPKAPLMLDRPTPSTKRRMRRGGGRKPQPLRYAGVSAGVAGTADAGGGWPRDVTAGGGVGGLAARLDAVDDGLYRRSRQAGHSGGGGGRDTATKSSRGELAKKAAHALGREPSRDSQDTDGGLGHFGHFDGQRRHHHQLQHPAAASSSPAGEGNGKSSSGSSGVSGKLLASVGLAGGLAVLVGSGFFFKDQIVAFLDYFITLVDNCGPLGYLAYIAVYTGLEVLAVPAIPLTMTAGAIFGVVPGTAVVSVAGTMACTISFLIARYVARDKIQEIEKAHPRFAAIDRAIGRDSFRVVTLLRLSPLLPLAASNYLYGLTSVELAPYVLGSWLGMLPGTFAYVSAGTYGKALLGLDGAESSPVPIWQVALGLGLTAFAVYYVGRLASQAIAEVDADLTQDADDSSLH